MQNKGALKFLAIVLAIACAYQLSFTFVTRHVEKQAARYAAGDPVKEQNYLDSVKSQPVYNLGFVKFNYKECKEKEINLGLDLRGGMNVMLEISVEDVVRALSNDSKDPVFNQALAQAREAQKSSTSDYITLFASAYEKVSDGGKLCYIFNTPELREVITPASTNEQVIRVLREQAEGAIANSFNVLRNRIDRFGVAQPNIQRLENSGRILVELPGVKEPERVRKLLQGTASLEFWATYENNEIYPALEQANALIRDLQAAGSLQVADQRIGLFEGGINLVVFVSGPEFEAGRSLQQLADTLRLLDAGQFHQNTAGIFEALDIGLCHTETVDTVAQHVERVGNGAFCLFAQYADHLFVGTGRGNHLAQLGRIENVAQLAAVRHLLISRGEERNIVAGAAFLGLPGLGERLVEHRVLAVVGQCAHDVFNRNLEHDVHTAAQVETEVDLFLLALLVVELHEPEVIHGLRLDGVQIILLLDRIPGGITGGLLLDMARHKRERKLVRAGYCKNNRQKF